MKTPKDLNRMLTTVSESRTSGECKPSEQWDQAHAERIAQVWCWMAEMFGPKWQTQWGEMADQNNQPTQHFLSWYQKTRKLTPSQWKCAFDRVERKITADIANDRDPWPPTTPGIFVAMSNPPRNESVGASGNAEKSFKEHPYIEEKRQERKMLAQPGFKERQRETGNKALNGIKDLF